VPDDGGPDADLDPGHSEHGFLPAEAFDWVRRRVPLVCVDLLPWRRFEQGLEVLLIKRRQRSERTGWALVGGRIMLDETIAEAADRHLRETLGDGVRAEPRSFDRPDEVAEYQRGPGPIGEATFDPSQHSVALNYCVEVDGEVDAGGEALDLRWYAPVALPGPDDIVFGQHALIVRLAGLTGRRG
jgi:ADP-ribose pyrophosphatase YjhB (NUDIX family)